MQSGVAGTHSSKTSGEIGCLNDAPKTSREKESSSRMQEETLIAVAVRRTMFEGSGGLSSETQDDVRGLGGKTRGLDKVLGLNTIDSGCRA